MVSTNQQNCPMKPSYEFQYLLLGDLTAKVTKVENNPIFWYCLIPVPDECLIHCFNIRKPWSVLDYPCAVKVGVSSEEGVVRSEGREIVCLVWVEQGYCIMSPSFGFLFHSMGTSATGRMKCWRRLTSMIVSHSFWRKWRVVKNKQRVFKS